MAESVTPRQQTMISFRSPFTNGNGYEMKPVDVIQKRGPLAITPFVGFGWHKDPVPDPDRCVITHLPTGCSIGHFTFTLAEAERFLSRLTRDTRLAATWRRRKPFKPGPKLKTIIKAHVEASRL